MESKTELWNCAACNERIDDDRSECLACGFAVCTGCLVDNPNEVDVSPYFKRGDDFSFYLDNSDSVSQALKDWARNLRGAAEDIELLGAALQGAEIGKLECVADIHFVTIPMDDDAMAAAERSGLLSKHGCVSHNKVCGKCAAIQP